MTFTERALSLENEVFILLDSGELPEVTYYSVLHALTTDPEGPQLVLTLSEQKMLQDAALVRCKKIVLRDLKPAYRDHRIWRGPQRSIYNWQRYLNFCQRIERQPDAAFKERTAAALTAFIAQELADVQSGRRKSSVNCSSQDLFAFARQLGLANDALPAGWQSLCPELHVAAEL